MLYHNFCNKRPRVPKSNIPFVKQVCFITWTHLTIDVLVCISFNETYCNSIMQMFNVTFILYADIKSNFNDMFIVNFIYYLYKE